MCRSTVKARPLGTRKHGLHGEPEVHIVQIGGRTGDELLAELTAADIKLNEHARTLLGSGKFPADGKPRQLAVVVASVADLGLTSGASFEAICGKALERQLALCPIELAPHFRLQYRDQPEGFTGYPGTRGVAPPGPSRWPASRWTATTISPKASTCDASRVNSGCGAIEARQRISGTRRIALRSASNEASAVAASSPGTSHDGPLSASMFSPSSCRWQTGHRNMPSTSCVI